MLEINEDPELLRSCMEMRNTFVAVVELMRSLTKFSQIEGFDA